MISLLSVVALCCISSVVDSAFHPQSPCPNVFTYFGSEPDVDRWYGDILMSTDEILYNVMLDLQFDRQVDLLVSWLGEVTTKDNAKFTIVSLSQKLLPDYPVTTRFLVKYDSNRGSPQLTTIYLNKKQICPLLPSVKHKPSRRPDLDFGDHTFNNNHQGSQGQNHNPIINSYQYSNNNTTSNNNNNNDNGHRDYVNPLRQPPNYNIYNTNYNSGTTYETRPIHEDNNNFNNYETTPKTKSPETISESTYHFNKPNNKDGSHYYTDNIGTSSTAKSTTSGINSNNNNKAKPTRQNSSTSSPSYTPNTTKKTGDSNKRFSTERTSNKRVTTQRVPIGPNMDYGNSFGNPDYLNPSDTDTNNRNTTASQWKEFSVNGGNQFETVDSQQCGEPEESRPLALIVNGQNTYRGQWPWHVAIYKISTGSTEFICGGTLISSKTVLTAAHCVTKVLQETPVDSRSLAVYLGKYRLTDISEDDGVQTKQVKSIHVYHGYNSSTFLGDIALLILTRSAHNSKYVKECCLWSTRLSGESIIGKNGTIVGWGLDERERLSGELKMGKMYVVDRDECVSSYESYFSRYTSQNTLCAGSRQEASACNGDSGGGLFFYKDSRWYIRALISNTVARGDIPICDTRHYVVFTDILHYIRWINEYIE